MDKSVVRLCVFKRVCIEESECQISPPYPLSPAPAGHAAPQRHQLSNLKKLS